LVASYEVLYSLFFSNETGVLASCQLNSERFAVTLLQQIHVFFLNETKHTVFGKGKFSQLQLLNNRPESGILLSKLLIFPVSFSFLILAASEY